MNFHSHPPLQTFGETTCGYEWISCYVCVCVRAVCVWVCGVSGEKVMTFYNHLRTHTQNKSFLFILHVVYLFTVTPAPMVWPVGDTTFRCFVSVWGRGAIHQKDMASKPMCWCRRLLYTVFSRSCEKEGFQITVCSQVKSWVHPSCFPMI